MADGDNIIRLAELQGRGELPHTAEENLALVFADRHADALRFIAAWGRWMVWDGVRWKPDATRVAFSLARAVCREAATMCDRPKLAAQVASARTRAAVVTLASDDRQLAASTDQWDCNLDAFNVREV